jgi:hypothetical protein
MSWTFYNSTGSALTSLGRVAVSDLANGTDGQLITWGTDAVATTVAVGTSGHVLTSGGADAVPSFAAPIGQVKAWCQMAADGSKTSTGSSNNIAGTAKNSTGRYTVTLTTAFANTTYSAVANATTGIGYRGHTESLATGTYDITTHNASGSLTDSINMSIAAGDQ